MDYDLAEQRIADIDCANSKKGTKIRGQFKEVNQAHFAGNNGSAPDVVPDSPRW